MGQIRQKFPDVPLMALTASATPLYVAIFLAEAQTLFAYCEIGYKTTLLASLVWTRTVFSNLYTPSTGPIYFMRCDASKNIVSPAVLRCWFTLVVGLVPFVRGWDGTNG